jgi:hypothetical protein
MSDEPLKRGDRVQHGAIGAATVVWGKLGPNGEIRVRPDMRHHSKKATILVMARRCTRIDPSIT